MWYRMCGNNINSGVVDWSGHNNMYVMYSAFTHFLCDPIFKWTCRRLHPTNSHDNNINEHCCCTRRMLVMDAVCAEESLV